MNTTYPPTSALRRVALRLAPLVACLSLSSANAQLLISGSPGSANLLTDTVGYKFAVGTNPLSAHRLGVYDSGGDGLDSMNIIGLWLEGGTLLTTAILPSGKSAPLESGFRWFDLTTPILLSANTAYRIGVQANLEMHPSGSATGLVSPDITLVGAVRNNQQGNFTYPGTTPAPAQAIVGPNIAYTVVPEPSVAHLIAATAIALFTTRWLKRFIPRQRRAPIQRRIRR